MIVESESVNCKYEKGREEITEGWMKKWKIDKQLLFQCHSWSPSGVFRPLKSLFFQRQFTHILLIPPSSPPCLSFPSISPCITHIVLFSSNSQLI